MSGLSAGESASFPNGPRKVGAECNTYSTVLLHRLKLVANSQTTAKDGAFFFCFTEFSFYSCIVFSQATTSSVLTAESKLFSSLD